MKSLRLGQGGSVVAVAGAILLTILVVGAFVYVSKHRQQTASVGASSAMTIKPAPKKPE